MTRKTDESTTFGRCPVRVRVLISDVSKYWTVARYLGIWVLYIASYFTVRASLEEAGNGLLPAPMVQAPRNFLAHRDHDAKHQETGSHRARRLLRNRDARIGG